MEILAFHLYSHMVENFCAFFVHGSLTVILLLGETFIFSLLLPCVTSIVPLPLHLTTIHLGPYDTFTPH
jgi:hypothetical protein